MDIHNLIPESIRGPLNRVLDLLNALLLGETALVIGNGAAVVIYLAAKALGSIPDQTFEAAVTSATAGLLTVNSVLLLIRRYVYSPATVAKIVTAPPTAAGPIEAAMDAGVKTEAIIKASDDHN